MTDFDPFAQIEGPLDQQLFAKKKDKPTLSSSQIPDDREIRSEDQTIDSTTNQPTNQIGDQAIDKSINQSIDQSTNQSTSRTTNHQASQKSGKIVDKPRGFYITEDLDTMLDSAVRYYREQHGIKKADRSTILNALVDKEELFTPEALDQIRDKVIELLTRRFIG